MDKEKRSILIVLIIFGLTLFGPFITIITASSEIQNQIVPLSGMPYTLHIIIFYLIWPFVLSIICVIIFPLILSPLFLMIKRRIWSRFKDCYVDMGDLTFDFKKFIKRGLYVALMLVGIIITIADIIDPSLFLTQYDIAQTKYSGNILYDPAVINSLVYLIVPFVIGIWAVGWVMEDVGLMHYKIPKANEKILFEIEPVHLKYNGIIKGYAGVSSIIFLITAISVYLSIWPAHILQVIMTIIFMTFYIAPSYIIYLKTCQAVFRKRFRKGLKEIKMISDNDIKLG